MLMPKAGKGCTFEDAAELAKLTKRWRPDCNYHARALLVLHEQSSIKFFAAGTCQV
jgi:hypothetical protein